MAQSRGKSGRPGWRAALDASLRGATGRGLPLGTVVLTMDGALPVEYLSPGDRIITRAGMRVLRNVDTPAPLAFALGFDAPEVIFADGRQVRSDTCATVAA